MSGEPLGRVPHPRRTAAGWVQDHHNDRHPERSGLHNVRAAQSKNTARLRTTARTFSTRNTASTYPHELAYQHPYSTSAATISSPPATSSASRRSLTPSIQSCQALMANGDNTTAKNSEARSKSCTKVAPYFSALESLRILPRVACERTKHLIFSMFLVPKRNSTE